MAFVSAEDELVCRFAPDVLVRVFARIQRRRMAGADLLGRGISHMVQRAAQSQAFASRQTVMKMDTWLDEAISFSPATGH